MNFYDQLSPFYDLMISFESRFNNEKNIFKKVLQKYSANTILDAGCGSGYHSLLLSSLGVEVTGFDPAAKMIELAKNNRQKYNYEIEFYNTDFLNYTQKIRNRFDAIFTLGNSFAHLLSQNDILHTLKNFNNSLNLDGYVCLGIVNFDRVLNLNQLEISKKEKNGILFHRYYSLNEETITFHISLSGKRNAHYKTQLFPLTSEILISLAKKADFTKIKLFGNLKFEKYDQNNSENIVAFLTK